MAYFKLRISSGRPPLVRAVVITTVLLTLVSSDARAEGTVTLLNASYDPTRELYKEVNTVFREVWQKQTGERLTVNQSHGGSGKQARSVIDGLGADVVTLALSLDIDAIAEQSGAIARNWQSRLPHNSSPYTSTIVLVVRKGNPKAIKDWDDLGRPGVGVITPNPKTGGGARWNYLAAWGYGLLKYKDDDKARDLVARIYRNVKVLDSGARGSTTTFAQRGIGDVLISWENEAFLLLEQLGKGDKGSDKKGEFEVVVPSVSILAEPPVAVVDRVVDKNGTRAVAEAYLRFLYSEQGQQIVARYHYRPRSEAVAKAQAGQFVKTHLFTIDEVFKSWPAAQRRHFDDGGEYDKIFASPAP